MGSEVELAGDEVGDGDEVLGRAVAAGAALRGLDSSMTGTALGPIESPPVPQWVRPLIHLTSAAAEWHVPRTKSFTTTAYCGKELAGLLEVASDDKAEREGRCQSCVTRLAKTGEGSILQRTPQPVPQTRPSPVIKQAAAKKTTAKKALRKLAPTKGRRAKAPVEKRPLRRSRRGTA